LAHARRFRALRGHEMHVSTDMIAVAKYRQLRFIAVSVLLQSLNAFFDQTTESGADLESFACIRAGIFDGHSLLLFRA
jgi:hypothetical protein